MFMTVDTDFAQRVCVSPVALAMLEGTRSVGIPTFENQNGRMMESAGGCSLVDFRNRDGKRQSVSGSTKNRFRHARALSLFSGKAIRISTRQTYRHARLKYRLPPLKC
jgi:hypothetical protein